MSSNNSNNAFYLILGILIGGIIALLFAPKKGKELRRNILEMLDKLQETGSNKFQNTSNDIQEFYKDNKDFVIGNESNTEINVKEIIN